MSDGRSIGMGAGLVIGGLLAAPTGGMSIYAGATLGASIGGMVGGMIDPPKSKLPNTQQPSELTINTSHRNLPVPIVYGVVKIGGNIIWMGNIRTEVRETGGGGKGKPAQRKTYYHAKWALSLSEGEIEGLGRFWLNEQEVKYTPAIGKEASHGLGLRGKAGVLVFASIVEDGEAFLSLAEDSINLAVNAYKGSSVQATDINIVSEGQTANAPAFRNTAYLFLGGSIGETPALPQVSAEVLGIKARITPVGLGFPTTFKRWQLASEWAVDHYGTITGPGYPDFLFWITGATDESLAIPLAQHKASNVYVDMDQDFTLKFFIEGTISAQVSAMNRVGLTIGRRDTDGIIFQFGLNQSAHFTPFNGYTATLDFAFGSYILRSFAGIPASGTLMTDHAWIRVEKRGDIVSVYVAQLGETDWNLAGQTTVNSVTMQASTPGTLYISAEQIIATPKAYISDLHFSYISTVDSGIADRGNPADIVYDFLTNTRYGLGLPEESIDVDSFIEGRDFCDEDINFPSERVPTVYPDVLILDAVEEPGEPRFRLDIALTEKKDAKAHLEDMLSTFRASLLWSNGKVKLLIEKEEESTQSFSDVATEVKSGIIENSFSFGEISSRERPNLVKVEYVRGDDGYRKDFVVARDEFDEEIRGEVIERNYGLDGIKRQSQANRMVQYFIDVSQSVRFVCQFRVGIGAMKCEVGDVISVTHARPGWTDRLFRVCSVSEEENDELQLSCVEYVATVYHDTPVAADITGTTILANDAFVDPPNAIRLRAFEPRDSAYPLLYVTWSLNPAYGFYFDTFVYRQRLGLLFESQGAYVVNANTAYLDHSRIGYESLPVSDSGLAAGAIAIGGDITGMSAKAFDADNNLLASATESGGVITLDLAAESNPVSGYIQLYVDAAYTYAALRGRFPASGNYALAHKTELTYNEDESAYGANPSTVRVASVLGAFTATGDVQLESRELSYTEFLEDLDGDKLNGVTFDLEPASVTPENRITDLYVSSRDSGTHTDRTAAFASAGTTVTLFPANGDSLYIGSATAKPVLLWLLLQRFASHDVDPLFTYSVDSAGTYEEVESVTDGTEGFTASGLITVEPPVDWTKTAKDSAGNTIGDGTERYYVRIVRQAATVTTTPQERRAYVYGDQLLTLQEVNNRFDYLYTDDDIYGALTFEALTENITGGAADATKIPSTSLQVIRYALIPPQVANAQLGAQGNDLTFSGGDAVFNWQGVSRRIGAGRIMAGVWTDGAGGGAMDPDFQNYVVEIYTADGLTFKRLARVSDTDGAGTYTYTAANRATDGLGDTFMVKLYQEAGNLFSEAVTLNIVAA